MNWGPSCSMDNTKKRALALNALFGLMLGCKKSTFVAPKVSCFCFGLKVLNQTTYMVVGWFWVECFDKIDLRSVDEPFGDLPTLPLIDVH